MAYIELAKKGRPRKFKGLVISYGDKTEIRASRAFGFLGSDDYKITYDATDKSDLKRCNKRQVRRLIKEFGGKDLESSIKKMYPKKKTKTIIPKIPSFNKKKEEPKKSKIEIKEPKTVKRPRKVSEQL
tara:strand:- start:2630 stop:3013 length:384 start_codon:yes stop_codon:yes gene_type:complete